jgi:hypothetical protein
MKNAAATMSGMRREKTAVAAAAGLLDIGAAALLAPPTSPGDDAA